MFDIYVAVILSLELKYYWEMASVRYMLTYLLKDRFALTQYLQ